MQKIASETATNDISSLNPLFDTIEKGTKKSIILLKPDKSSAEYKLKKQINQILGVQDTQDDQLSDSNKEENELF